MNSYDRLHLLEMARSTQDVDCVIERAKKLEAYVYSEASVHGYPDPATLRDLPSLSNVVTLTRGPEAERTTGETAGAHPGSDPGEPAQAAEPDPTPTLKPRKAKAVKAKGKRGRPAKVKESETATVAMPETSGPVANGAAGEHVEVPAGDRPQMAA